MERSIPIESWEEMQRHGQDIADRFSSLAQGIGCMLQSHIRTSAGICLPQAEARTGQQQQGWGIKVQLPWPFAGPQQARGSIDRVRFDAHKPAAGRQQSAGPEISSAFYDVGHRLGQAGADLGACVGGLVGHVVKQFHKPQMSMGTASLSTSAARQNGASLTSDVEIPGGTLEWKEREDDGSGGIVISSWQAAPANSRQRRGDESPSTPNSDSEPQDAASDELLAAIAKSSNQFHKQSSITVTTTYDSRTQDIESSVVARGDLWRAEASHGGASSSNGSSALFLLQIGPILFVRDTTLLLPIHLSKRHLLWYGFDRKNGLHSLCPAIWSKHRRYLLMSMICLNPLTCSFMDLQFPNGQMTYVAGEGLSGSAFLPMYGGLLQVQGRHPGESKLSFSCKNQWGTRICPCLHLPDKSLSVGVTQPLAWQRSGLMLRPTIQMSVTPTFGGRNAGWRAEVIHSPKEKLSFTCGCALSLEPSAFASVSLGRSKRNGEHTGSSGLVLQVETPVENLRRASFSVQLNSGVEF